MSKMSELDLAVKELNAAAQSLIGATNSLKVLFSQTDESATANTQPEKESKSESPMPIALEKVRGVLADKSRNGFTAEVRALLEKHGGSKLSNISPDRYADLLKDAEGLK